MAFHTIKLKNYSNIFEEYVAHEAIIPGSLIELNSDNEVQKHATAGGNSLPMFAIEDALQGNGIEDAYATGDQVNVWIPTRGDNVYAILEDGENVAIGDFLESAGDGYLKKHTADSAGVVEYPAAIVAVALEALNLTGSSGTAASSGITGFNKRLKVKIL